MAKSEYFVFSESLQFLKNLRALILLRLMKFANDTFSELFSLGLFGHFLKINGSSEFYLNSSPPKVILLNFELGLKYP